MNDVIEAAESCEKLKHIIDKNGEAILDDPNRLEGLLKDHLGPHPRQISALVGALGERVPSELRSPWQSAMTPEAMRARLVQRLCDHRGLAADVAEWAVDTWSYALGVELGRKSDQLVTTFLCDADAAGPLSAPQDAFSNNTAGRLLASFGASKTPSSKASKTHSDAENLAAASGAVVNQSSIATPKQRARLGALAAVAVLTLAIALWSKWPKPQTVIQTAQTQTPSQPVPPSSETPRAAPVIAAGTTLVLRLETTLDSDHAQLGDTVHAVVAASVIVDDKEAIRPGENAVLKVTAVSQAGHFKGVSKLQLVVSQLNIGGKVYNVSSTPFTRSGPSQADNTARNAGAGGGGGCAAGAAASKSKKKGCSLGGAIGGLAGIGYQAVTHPKPVVMSAGDIIHVRLLQPIVKKT